MTKQELIILCDMIEGNCNRMMVTESVGELISRFNSLKHECSTLYVENLKRLGGV